MRYFHTFTFIFLLSFTSKAQGDYWGVKAGLNVSKISQLNISNGFKPGFHLGVFGTFHTVIDKLTFTHELLFSTRGVSLSLNDSLKALNGNNGSYSKSFNYIDIPWMLNYNFSDAFYVNAGGQLSVYAHFKKPSGDPIVYNKGNVNTIDVGYLVGAGFLFENNIGFGVRLTGSLIPTFDTGDKGNTYVMQAFLNYAVNKKRGRRR